MREIIPFDYDIKFTTSIANIVSIALEHEEVVKKGEINGEFIVFGDYKAHNDSTQEDSFKYRIPYMTVIPDTIVLGSVEVGVENFTYEIVDSDILRVHIEYSVFGQEGARYSKIEDDVLVDEVEEDRNDDMNNIEDVVVSVENIEEKEVKDVIKKEEVTEEIVEVDDSEYVTYKIHIVEENETLEEILKKCETTLDVVKNYNDVSSINVGDKIIIPAYLNE